jgi:hypothetical protein
VGCQFWGEGGWGRRVDRDVGVGGAPACGSRLKANKGRNGGGGWLTVVHEDARGKGCAEAVFVCDVEDCLAGMDESVGCGERRQGACDDFVLGGRSTKQMIGLCYFTWPGAASAWYI